MGELNMRTECISDMTWEEAPDTITPKDLAHILGIGIAGARKIFNKKDFPKISESVIGNIGKADKEVARLYIQGISLKRNAKDDMLNLIYLELKQINSKLNSRQNTQTNEKDYYENENKINLKEILMNNETIWKELAKEGIHNEQELDKAIRNMKLLNIGGFVNKPLKDDKEE
jgi:hypothetical protein